MHIKPQASLSLCLAVSILAACEINDGSTDAVGGTGGPEGRASPLLPLQEGNLWRYDYLDSSAGLRYRATLECGPGTQEGGATFHDLVLTRRDAADALVDETRVVVSNNGGVFKRENGTVLEVLRDGASPGAATQAFLFWNRYTNGTTAYQGQSNLDVMGQGRSAHHVQNEFSMDTGSVGAARTVDEYFVEGIGPVFSRLFSIAAGAGAVSKGEKTYSLRCFSLADAPSPCDFGATVVATYVVPDNGYASYTDFSWDGTTLWFNGRSRDQIYQVNRDTGAFLAVLETRPKEPKWGSIPSKSSTSGLAMGGDEVWVTRCDHQVIRLDRSTGVRAEALEIGGAECLTGLYREGEVLWASDAGRSSSKRVYRIDLASRKVVGSIPSTGWYYGLAWKDGHLWAMDRSGPSRMLELDPADGRVLSSLPAPSGDCYGLEYDGEHFWVSCDAGENPRAQVYKLTP